MSHESCPGPDEEFVESMAQQVVKLLKCKETKSVRVEGWSGIGRRRVMDHVVAAITKCEDLSGCIRTAKPSEEQGFVEYEIRSKMEQLVQRPLWARIDNKTFWSDVGRSLNWNPIVLILDEMEQGINPTILGIPQEIYPDIELREPAILLKTVFTSSRDSSDTRALGYPIGVEEEYVNLPHDVALHMLVYEVHSAAMTTKTEFLPRLIKENLNIKPEEMTSMAFSSLAPIGFMHPDIDNLRGEAIIQFLFYCRLFQELQDPLDYLRSEDLPFNCFDLSENSWNATLLFTSLLQDLRQRCLIEDNIWSRFGMFGMQLYISLPRNLEEQLAAAFATCSSSALTIIRHAQGYLVRHSKGLRQVDMAEWSQDLTKISFANNLVKRILLPPPPSLLNFPNLSTLILGNNKTLEEIPSDVFHYMPNLRVLDLSNCCNINILPSSLSCLANLRMLSLRGCGNLQTIDMSGLDNLEVLNLQDCPLYELENALWGHMHSLKHLNFRGYALQSLKELQLSVRSVKVFDAFGYDIRDAFPHASYVQKFKVVVLYPNEEEAIKRRRTRDAHFQTGQFPYKHLHAHAQAQANPLSTSPHPSVSGVVDNPYDKYLEINGGEGLWSLYTLIVIVRPHRLSLHNYQNAREGIWSSPELKECDINSCNDMEFAFNFHGYDGKSIWMLKNLQTLWISSLAKLHAICSDRFEQLESFQLLKSIYLNCCPNLVALFSMMVCLPSLEVMEVRFCARLEKLFRHHTTGEIVLPRLKRLHLCGLPKLTSICDEGHLPLLEKLEVRGCWNLKSVPFSSFDPHSYVLARVVVRGEAEWWKNVQGCNKDRIDFGIGSISATPKHIPYRLNRGGRHSIQKQKAGHHRRR